MWLEKMRVSIPSYEYCEALGTGLSRKKKFQAMGFDSTDVHKTWKRGSKSLCGVRGWKLNEVQCPSLNNYNIFINNLFVGLARKRGKKYRAPQKKAHKSQCPSLNNYNIFINNLFVGLAGERGKKYRAPQKEAHKSQPTTLLESIELRRGLNAKTENMDQDPIEMSRKITNVIGHDSDREIGTVKQNIKKKRAQKRVLRL
ncbi:hypothetical protein C5167_044180 [Papaver somniferum]|uniref:Uncharacterized protein n=1 Tax=Papaver somniferum TaxID=3469 RepID=A0A4Y7LBD6_PAPSO|nr:hypothetical protein C5167_044180 [Papaver somniferum]